MTSWVYCTDLPSRKDLLPLFVDRFSGIAFAIESHLIHGYTLPGTAHFTEVGVERPGHFTLGLGQFCRAIFAPELPKGLIEAGVEPAEQPCFSLYPLLLPSSPFHRYWFQENLKKINILYAKVSLRVCCWRTQPVTFLFTSSIWLQKSHIFTPPNVSLWLFWDCCKIHIT